MPSKTRSKTAPDKDISSDGLKRRRLYGRRRGRVLRKGRKALLEELLPTLRIELGDRPPRSRRPVRSPRHRHLARNRLRRRRAPRRPRRRQPRYRLPRRRALSRRHRELAQAHRRRRPRQRPHSHGRRRAPSRRSARRLSRTRLSALSRPLAQSPPREAPLSLPRKSRPPAPRHEPGAELLVATDHPVYLAWAVERMASRKDFAWLAERPEDWREPPADWPGTRYEEKAIREGRKPTYLRYCRNALTP